MCCIILLVEKGGKFVLISSKGRYAVRVMLYLALDGSGKFVPIKQIAESEKISVKYLEAIVAILCKARFLDSHRGKDGGYRLARSSAEYTIGEILKAAEGDINPVDCHDCGPGGCQRTSDCLSKHVWMGLEAMLDEYLEGITLKDLIDRGAAGRQN